MRRAHPSCPLGMLLLSWPGQDRQHPSRSCSSQPIVIHLDAERLAEQVWQLIQLLIRY